MHNCSTTPRHPTVFMLNMTGKLLLKILNISSSCARTIEIVMLSLGRCNHWA